MSYSESMREHRISELRRIADASRALIRSGTLDPEAYRKHVQTVYVYEREAEREEWRPYE